jgi:hypothetical protein
VGQCLSSRRFASRKMSQFAISTFDYQPNNSVGQRSSTGKFLSCVV